MVSEQIDPGERQLSYTPIIILVKLLHLQPRFVTHIDDAAIAALTR